MSAGHLVVAWHGCDITTRDDLVSGRIKHLEHSKNKYDWLGPGSYFFEEDPLRALEFAKASKDHPDLKYTALPIARPAVVGAVLRVRHWLDMTTQTGIREFANAYLPTCEGIQLTGGIVPVNTKAHAEDKDIIFRALDNAIFTFIHAHRSDPVNRLEPYQAVRGAFPQGTAVVENSGFRSNTHIQIAVLDNSCIGGWFLLPEDKLLSTEQYQEAVKNLQLAKAQPKPRKRVTPPA